MMKTNKLLLIQASLKCPKNQVNKFGGYNYRSCEDILEAVKPLLYDTQTTLTISDNIVAVGDRIYVEATATLRDTETGEIIEQNVAYAREDEAQKGMQPSQLTGATSSYARKYALNGLFLLDDVKDADATNTHGKEKAEKKTTPYKESKEDTESDATDKDNPNGWFLKATKSTKFMESCLDANDFINKIRAKYNFGEVEERQLREAYDNHMGNISDSPDNLPFE